MRILFFIRLGQQLWSEALFLLDARECDPVLLGAACVQKPSLSLCAMLRTVLFANVMCGDDEKGSQERRFSPEYCLATLLASLNGLETRLASCSDGGAGMLLCLSPAYIVCFHMSGRALTGLSDEDWAALTELTLSHAIARGVAAVCLHLQSDALLQQRTPAEKDGGGGNMSKLAALISHLHRKIAPAGSDMEVEGGLPEGELS